jgi:uncharacterized protein (DUF1778 family)
MQAAETHPANLVVRISADQHETIRRAAVSSQVTVSELVRAATLDWATRLLAADAESVR